MLAPSCKLLLSISDCELLIKLAKAQEHHNHTGTLILIDIDRLRRTYWIAGTLRHSWLEHLSSFWRHPSDSMVVHHRSNEAIVRLQFAPHPPQYYHRLHQHRHRPDHNCVTLMETAAAVPAPCPVTVQAIMFLIAQWDVLSPTTHLKWLLWSLWLQLCPKIWSGQDRSQISDQDRSQISDQDRSQISGQDRSQISGQDRSQIFGQAKSQISSQDRSQISGRAKF